MIPLHQCIPGAVAALLRQQPFSPAKLQFAWRTAVGPGMDRATAVRLADRATLVVEALDEHWRAEVERASSLLLARLEMLLGPGVVERVSVTIRRSHA